MSVWDSRRAARRLALALTVVFVPNAPADAEPDPPGPNGGTGARILVTGGDDLVRILDMAVPGRGETVVAYTGTDKPLTSVEQAPDGAVLVGSDCRRNDQGGCRYVNNLNGFVHRWERRNGGWTRTAARAIDVVATLGFHDGALLVVGRDAFFRLDPQTLGVRLRRPLRGWRAPTAAARHGDEVYLALNGTVYAMPRGGRAERAAWAWSCDCGGIRALAASPARIGVGTAAPDKVSLISADEGTEVTRIPMGDPIPADSLAALDEGRFAVSRRMKVRHFGPEGRIASAFPEGPAFLIDGITRDREPLVNNAPFLELIAGTLYASGGSALRAVDPAALGPDRPGDRADSAAATGPVRAYRTWTGTDGAAAPVADATAFDGRIAPD